MQLMLNTTIFDEKDTHDVVNNEPEVKEDEDEEETNPDTEKQS